MDPKVELMLMITDRIFLALQNMQEVSGMSDEEVLKEIERERLKKDSLVEEVTL